MPDVPVMDRNQLERRFAHHPPSTPRVADLHGALRRRCLDLAEWLNVALPSSEEALRAIDALDDVCKHGNAAIARHANPAGDELGGKP
jgi:hypothetical protein